MYVDESGDHSLQSIDDNYPMFVLAFCVFHKRHYSGARPIGLSVLRPEQENQAFKVLEKKFYCAGGRDRVGQQYNGFGLKIYPSRESEKPR